MTIQGTCSECKMQKKLYDNGACGDCQARKLGAKFADWLTDFISKKVKSYVNRRKS